MTKYELAVSLVIYRTLFRKSIVDGVRVLHEDDWPVDELVRLFTEKNAMGKAIYELPAYSEIEERKEK